MSTLVASATSVTGDGVATVTLTATLLDKNGKAVSGESVTLASNRGASDSISPKASGTSNSLGVVIWTVKSSVVGTSIYSVTDSTSAITLAATAHVLYLSSGAAAQIGDEPGVNSPANPAFSYGTMGINGDKPFFVLNTGSTTLSLSDGSTLGGRFSYASGGFPGGSGSYTHTDGNTYSFCGATLASGATCMVLVRYTPTAPGTGTLTINASALTLVRNLAGTSVSTAYLRISEDPGNFGCDDSKCAAYDYGIIATDAIVSANFIITNLGPLPATLISGIGPGLPYAWNSFGGGSYPGGSGSATVDGVSYNYCSSVMIASGASCVITVYYAPSIVAAFSDLIELQYYNTSTTIDATRSITGTACPASSC